MMSRFDKQSFLFIARMCREENIAYFLGRDVYDFIISIFEKFITKFRAEL